ncbi:hypothetical protein SE23_05760 [Vibrio sinaloensis]|uniref:hypothetical protein n=1 Tax=Photobacterium sp. (strain ATCC 43367) TaxID=379097 RepID=UPI00057DEAFA|nr:hypothetical protein [Vibrio sinaloensis]KIE21722.1 hypothetical protein SE23_05760 [Vibrio sinaloensis]
MDTTQRYEFKFIADDLNLIARDDDLTKLKQLLVDLSLEADSSARATKTGQFRGAAYCTDANGLPFYEVFYDTPYPYLGCFQAFYDRIVSETDPNKVIYKLSTPELVLPCILPSPANDMISEQLGWELYRTIAKNLCDQVIRIENLDIHPAIQNTGIFKLLVEKLLDKYSYVLITAVINKKWAESLKPKALETYEEIRGGCFLLDKSFLD